MLLARTRLIPQWNSAASGYSVPRESVTKAVDVCGKNVTETLKHAYTCYDMVELKFWPLCSCICHVNVEVGEPSGRTVQRRNPAELLVVNGSEALSGAFSGAEQSELGDSICPDTLRAWGK
eukprot:Nk52_evm2s418 gene=Nk52_evmTU2s418